MKGRNCTTYGQVAAQLQSARKASCWLRWTRYESPITIAPVASSGRPYTVVLGARVTGRLEAPRATRSCSEGAAPDQREQRCHGGAPGKPVRRITATAIEFHLPIWSVRNVDSPNASSPRHVGQPLRAPGKRAPVLGPQCAPRNLLERLGPQGDTAWEMPAGEEIFQRTLPAKLSKPRAIGTIRHGSACCSLREHTDSFLENNRSPKNHCIQIERPTNEARH